MIGYAGLSHLGLISALAAADKGFETVGFDPDPRLVEAIAGGTFPVSEPGLAELFARARARIRFTSDPQQLRSCAVVYVAIDVPTDVSGRSDLTPVVSLAQVVATATDPGTVIVVLSQVHPGFTRELATTLGAARAVFYQVETLIFGRAIERALLPERFIVGCVNPAIPLPAPLLTYLTAFGCPVLPMRLESAELTKIAINMFLVSSVSTTNMLADVCEQIGADWREIAPALRLDRRIGQYAYLGPGLGIGGSNLGRDMATIEMLAALHGTDAGLIRAWRANSEYRRNWALRVLSRELRPAAGTTIAVWGLAYKEDTQSTFNSPAVELLAALRPFRLHSYDPIATLPPALAGLDIVQARSALDACDGADALAIMTPWAEFRAIGADAIARRLKGTLVVDPFAVLAADGDATALRRVHLGVGEMPTAGEDVEHVAV